MLPFSGVCWAKAKRPSLPTQDEGMNQRQVRVAGSLQRPVCWQQAPSPKTRVYLPLTRYWQEYIRLLFWASASMSIGKRWEKTIWTFLCFLSNFLFCTGVQPINNAVIVSGEQWRDSATYTRVSILPHTSLPARLPHHLEQSSMCCKAGPWWTRFKRSRVYTSISNSLTTPSRWQPWAQLLWVSFCSLSSSVSFLFSFHI